MENGEGIARSRPARAAARSAGWRFATSIGILVVLTLGSRPAAAEDPRSDWNDTGVAWKSYDVGLAAARASGRPICLVVHTTWCPDCALFSKIFHVDRVVERSKRFVMVRMDADRESALARRFAPDGQYIPRVLFLTPSGELLPQIHSERSEAIYNYPETDPDALLRGMDTALRAVGNDEPRKSDPADLGTTPEETRLEPAKHRLDVSSAAGWSFPRHRS